MTHTDLFVGVPSSGGSSFKPSSTKFAIETPEGITIAIVKGKLAEQNVDVIVNSTSKGLDLSSGAVSMSLLKAAGSQIQVQL